MFDFERGTFSILLIATTAFIVYVLVSILEALGLTSIFAWIGVPLFLAWWAFCTYLKYS